MKSILIILTYFYTFTIIAQANGPGSGKNLTFSNTQSTRINIPHSNALVHNSSKIDVTIEAWVNPSAINPSGGCIFSKHQTLGTREFSLFHVSNGLARFDVFDNSGTDYLTYSVSIIPLNTWTHIAGTYNSTTGISKIYINGVLDVTNNIGVISIANTTINPLIGAYWLSQSSNTLRSHFTGTIDEVRLWYTERSQTEIRDNMCKTIIAQKTHLKAYYRFDEANGTIAFDASGNNNNGTLINFTTAQTSNWGFSGAPIGNQSVYQYLPSWNGVQIELPSNTSIPDKISVQNIIGNPKGVHLYRVDMLPSQTGGLNDPINFYFGTFIAGGTSTQYDIHYSYYEAAEICTINQKLFNRSNNSISLWNDINATNNQSTKTLLKNNISSRGEFIFSSTIGNNFTINLGNDTSLCSNSTLILNPGQSYESYTWQDGSSNSTFIADSEGKYWVTVTNPVGCEKSDTLLITRTPDVSAISLGSDTSICYGNSILLYAGDNSFSYEWQDGSSNNSIIVNQPGIYWVKAKNSCTIIQDSITISLLNIMIPNLITPNNDIYNETFKILVPNKNQGSLSIHNRWGELIYKNDSYDNDWNGENLDAGIYYYNFKYPGCEINKGWVQIIR